MPSSSEVHRLLLARWAPRATVFNRRFLAALNSIRGDFSTIFFNISPPLYWYQNCPVKLTTFSAHLPMNLRLFSQILAKRRPFATNWAQILVLCLIIFDLRYILPMFGECYEIEFTNAIPTLGTLYKARLMGDLKRSRAQNHKPNTPWNLFFHLNSKYDLLFVIWLTVKKLIFHIFDLVNSRICLRAQG